jgi:hypothetical protein
MFGSLLSICGLLYVACLMNYLEWNRAVSVFPETTFRCRRTFVCRPQAIREDGVISREFTSRGYDIIRGGMDNLVAREMAAGIRAINQGWGFSIELDRRGTYLILFFYRGDS